MTNSGMNGKEVEGINGKCAHKRNGYMNFIMALHINVNLAIINGSISAKSLNMCVQKAQLRSIQMDMTDLQLKNSSVQHGQLSHRSCTG